MFYRFSPLMGRITQTTQFAAYCGLRGLPQNGKVPMVPSTAKSPEMFQKADMASETMRPMSEVPRTHIPVIRSDSDNEDLIIMGNKYGYVPPGYQEVEDKKEWAQANKAMGLRTYRVNETDNVLLVFTCIIGLATFFIFKTKFESVAKNNNRTHFGIW